MPELGQYGTSVIIAYLISFVIIGTFFLVTLNKSNQTKKELERLTLISKTNKS
jgi:heme exporter protein CcmD